MALLLPPAATAGAGPHKPVPVGDPATWFPGENYPADAMAAGIQGRVMIGVEIDDRGHPVGCTITHSVGIASLDDRTCELAMRNARFTPPRNSSGRPIASYAVLPVLWMIPPDADPREGRRQVADYVMEIAVDARGVARSCRTIRFATDTKDPCAAFKIGSFYGYYVAPSGEAIAATFTVKRTEYVDPN